MTRYSDIISIFHVYVMNQLDPIEELYNMYLDEEETLRIVEVVADELDFDLD